MVKVTEVWMKFPLYHAWNLNDHYHCDMVLYKDAGCPLSLHIALSWEWPASFCSLQKLLGIHMKGNCLFFQCCNLCIIVISSNKVSKIVQLKSEIMNNDSNIVPMCVCVCVCWYVNLHLLFVCYNSYSVGSSCSGSGEGTAIHVAK